MSILLLVIGILHLAHGLIEYVVYPANKKDVSACSRINGAIVKTLGASKVQAYQSRSRQSTEFWFVQALEAQKAVILQIPGVRIPIHNQHNHNDSF